MATTKRNTRSKSSQTEPMEDRYKYHGIKGDLLDLWDLSVHDRWIAVPTNGSVNSQKLAVMGAGVAKEVADEIPDLRRQLGRRLLTYGNWVHVFPPLKLITVPVKHEWNQGANLELIGRSLAELNGVVDHSMKHYGGRIGHVYVPLLGCGNGGLDYSQVEPLVVKYLGNDSRFSVVFLEEAYDKHYGNRKTAREAINDFTKKVPISVSGISQGMEKKKF